MVAGSDCKVVLERYRGLDGEGNTAACCMSHCVSSDEADNGDGRRDLQFESEPQVRSSRSQPDGRCGQSSWQLVGCGPCVKPSALRFPHRKFQPLSEEKRLFLRKLPISVNSMSSSHSIEICLAINLEK